MTEFPISYEQTPAPTELNDEARFDLHVGDPRLVSIEAARKLTRAANDAQRIEREEVPPLLPHERSRVHTRNLVAFRAAALHPVDTLLRFEQLDEDNLSKAA